MWEKYVTNVVLALFPITLLNFVVFAGIAYYLGGSALNGKIVSGHYSGHYYVGEHGHYTEVSHAVFILASSMGISPSALLYCSWTRFPTRDQGQEVLSA